MRIEEKCSEYLNTIQGDTKHKFIVDTYNTITPLPRGYRVKYTDSWCATFVSALAKLCNAKNFPYECSCYYMMIKAKTNNQIVKEPKVGYLVLYDWKNDGSVNHVGIITNINNSILTVIEGNKSKRVGVRKIDMNNNEIECFIKVEYFY